MLELRDPESGNVAVVVGTAHVSGQAAKDVQQLLEESRVEICAVELDRERLKSALRRLQSMQGGVEDVLRDAGSRVPDTPWKVLKLLYSKDGGPSRLFYLFSDSLSLSILGVPYGVDMLAAISAASRLGIQVIPIDRPSRITLARCMAQGDSFARLRKRAEEKMLHDYGIAPEDVQTDKTVSQSKARRLAAMRKMRDTLRSAAEVVGCADPERAVNALVTTVHSAMDDHEVDPEDLRLVRDCGTRMVEYVRAAAMAPGSAKVEVPGSGGGPDASDRGERLKDFFSNMTDDGPPALLSERDLILAQNLRLCTARGPTLAVVGAGHVPGIQRRWLGALSPASQEEAKKYYMVPGRPHSQGKPEAPALESYSAPSLDGKDVEWSAPAAPVKPVWTVPVGPLLVGAGLGVLGYYRPRATAVVGATFAGMVATGNYVVASAVASVGRAAARLEEAARKLAVESEGDSGGFFQ